MHVVSQTSRTRLSFSEHESEPSPSVTALLFHFISPQLGRLSSTFSSSTKPEFSQPFTVTFAQSRLSPAAQPAGPITSTHPWPSPWMGPSPLYFVYCSLASSLRSPEAQPSYCEFHRASLSTWFFPSTVFMSASPGHCKIGDVISLAVNITGEPCLAIYDQST